MALLYIPERAGMAQKHLAKAKDVATDWFNGLQAKNHLGELPTGKTFAQVAKVFEEEYEATRDFFNTIIFQKPMITKKKCLFFLIVKNSPQKLQTKSFLFP